MNGLGVSSPDLLALGHGDGREVDGFRLLKTLGKGGFAWVKQAKFIDTGKRVAVKFVQKVPYRKYKGRERNQIKRFNLRQKEEFETEVRCLLKLDHPNIIKLLAYNPSCTYPTAD